MFILHGALSLLLLVVSKGMQSGIYLLQNIEWSLYKRRKEFGYCVMKFAPASGLLAGQLRNFGLISDNVTVFVSVVRAVQTVLGLARPSVRCLSGVITMRLKRPVHQSEHCILFRQSVELYTASSHALFMAFLFTVALQHN